MIFFEMKHFVHVTHHGGDGGGHGGYGGGHGGGQQIVKVCLQTPKRTSDSFENFHFQSKILNFILEFKLIVYLCLKILQVIHEQGGYGGGHGGYGGGHGGHGGGGPTVVKVSTSF